MSSNVFSLAGLRLPLPPGPRLRNGQSSPLLGSGPNDERFSKQTLRRRGTLGRVWTTNKRYFQTILLVIGLVVSRTLPFPSWGTWTGAE